MQPPASPISLAHEGRDQALAQSASETYKENARMIELRQDIWMHYLVPKHFVCITTNGTIKKNGYGVMGRGNAKQAAAMLPGIDKHLGEYLRANGNHAGYFDEANANLIVFPTKHNWWEKADLKLIHEGAEWLRDAAKVDETILFHLPRPGCANGQRDWETEVRPILVDVGLPDNVWVHHV